MSTPGTKESIQALALLEANRHKIEAVFRAYGAESPRVFGSVARGEATATCDIDILVSLPEAGGNQLLGIAGINESLNELLGVPVDVIAVELCKPEVLAAALRDARSL